MHHHSFAVIDGHPALLRPCLQSLQNDLQWRVVRVPGGDWDVHGAVVHVLPAMGVSVRASLMRRRKNSGLILVPWRTPHVSYWILETEP